MRESCHFTNRLGLKVTQISKPVYSRITQFIKSINCINNYKCLIKTEYKIHINQASLYSLTMTFLSSSVLLLQSEKIAFQFPFQRLLFFLKHGGQFFSCQIFKINIAGISLKIESMVLTFKTIDSRCFWKTHYWLKKITSRNFHLGKWLKAGGSSLNKNYSLQ